MTKAVEAIARQSREAALALGALDTEERNYALRAVRDSLVAERETILEANRTDKDDARRQVEEGSLSKALFTRLDLEGEKFDGMIAGVDDVLKLPDPVGVVHAATRLDSGLDLYQVSCPIGVIGVIFEARPEAAVQISALTLKSANSVILKGGREADRTNRALAHAIRKGLSQVTGVPEDAVQLIATREEVHHLLDLDEWIDLIIPRGSNELVRSIQESTRIPVLGHADGICSVYLDASADPGKAIDVVVDSKTQYPATCNSVETLLVHRHALSVLSRVGAALRERGVELRCDAESLAALDGAEPSSEVDYDTEFLDLVLAVNTVDSLDDAIEHINRHGSHHTDAIVTEDAAAAERCMARGDSAGVFRNAATRFADGFRYGLGAEVGISTNKTHARGPVGLEGLVISKFRLLGNGQKVADYGPGRKSFQHERISTSQRLDSGSG